MSVSRFIEKYFWALLLAGIILGLWQPLVFTAPKYIPKLLLGMMLFTVFLKIDINEVIEKLKDFKRMILIALAYMIIIPLIFYFSIGLVDRRLALGVLLLLAMPAGVSTPALTDIAKGNVSLAMSIALITQVVAPFTVPLLFWMIGTKGFDVNKLLLLRDISIMVFTPLIIAQILKKVFPSQIKKRQHLFTSANILLLFVFVYIAIASQRMVILSNPVSLIWKTLFLYVVFILLHAIGYFIAFREKKEDRIAMAVSAAYMNNGLAIVLATTYFRPEIVVLMVLSEIPWNTLLAPFKKVIEMIHKAESRTEQNKVILH
jgi:bile acid:Na+ symporter, BASS family